MNCPACQTELRIADRQGVEIDYCPKCRGVWLDRGELDKIIERSQQFYPGGDSDDDYRPPSGERHPQQGYPKKRKSFWSEMFDFD